MRFLLNPLMKRAAIVPQTQEGAPGAHADSFVSENLERIFFGVKQCAIGA
jgi:hypothetical protein